MDLNEDAFTAIRWHLKAKSSSDKCKFEGK